MIFPDPAIRLINRLEDRGFEAWIVGGAVRDAWLKKEIHDIDIATSARPAEIEEVFSDCKTIDVGKAFGTIRVIWEAEVYELTTFRSEEGYMDGRHPDKVTYSNKIEDDLSRRDFTINAMAYNPSKGILDLYGGRDDFEEGILRAVGDPNERIGEDALRMLRAVRFAGRFDLKMDPELERAIKERKSRISRISVERSMDEINKMLTGRGAERTFEIMAGLGLSQILLPGIDRLPKDEVLNMLPKEPDFLWPALLSNGGEEGAEPGEKAVRILKAFKASNELMDRAGLFVGTVFEELPTDTLGWRIWLKERSMEEARTLLEYKRAFLELESDLNKLKIMQEILETIQKDKLATKISDLDISGRDLIACGFKPGRLIGGILEDCLDAHIHGKLANKKQVLLDYINSKWSPDSGDLI